MSPGRYNLLVYSTGVVRPFSLMNGISRRDALFLQKFHLQLFQILDFNQL